MTASSYYTVGRRIKSKGIDFELNSIPVEKQNGKSYRLVIQRHKRMDGDIDIWDGEHTYR